MSPKLPWRKWPVLLRRGLLLGLAACLSLGLLPACGSPAPKLEPTTITFAYPDFATAYYERLVDVFNEEYPHVTIELEPRNWDALEGINPGEADVFVTSQFALNWLSQEDAILDLTPFMEQDEDFDRDDFYPGTLDLYTSDGKTWGVPANVDLMVMYYNEELFDAYSVPYPQAGWTWDDFLATASSLRDPGSEVFGYGPMDEIFDPLVFIYQHGGGIFDDLQNPSRVTLDEPANVEALEFYVRLLLDYDVAPTPEQARDAFGAGGGNIQTGVFLGQVGMWSGMLSERGGLSWPAEWTMEWGMVSLPRDRRAATLTLVEGYFISSLSESSDACWAWVSFLSHQLPVARAPVRRSLAESDAYSQQVGDEVASVVRSSLADVLLLSPELADYEQALGAFGRALQAIMEGRATPEDALNQAQQRIQGQ